MLLYLHTNTSCDKQSILKVDGSSDNSNHQETSICSLLSLHGSTRSAVDEDEL